MTGFWTPEKDNFLRRLAAKDGFAEVAAVSLHTTTHVIWLRCGQLGVTLKTQAKKHTDYGVPHDRNVYDRDLYHAKIYLQRNDHVVYSASVNGGPKNLFQIDEEDQLVSRGALIERARKLQGERGERV